MKLFKTGFEREIDRMKAAKTRFEISTRPYYSAGGYRFDVVQVEEDKPEGSGLTRLVCLAEAGQKIDFFSYGLGDNVQGAGLANRAADLADTNMAERTNTNNEDFVVEGISATSRGARIQYPDQDDDPSVFDNQIWNLAVLGTQTGGGQYIINDPGSNILPPEASSPVTLQDALFASLGAKVSLRMEWNRKATDYLGTLDQIPEGGAAPYVTSNGVPDAMNYWRVPEGYVWRREGAPRDSIMTITATLEQPVLMIMTLPITFNDGDEAAQLNLPTRIDIEWKMRLHGKAIYLPSLNV